VEKQAQKHNQIRELKEVGISTSVGKQEGDL